MELRLREKIEEQYNIRLCECTLAPRQWVAETYIIVDENGNKYFCKIIDKELLIPGIIKTLPVVAEMHEKGIDRISYPIRGKDGFSFLVDKVLVVLFNYIPASQGFDFNLNVFGELIAEVHNITSKITAKAPVEMFDFPNDNLFEDQFEGTLKSNSENLVIKEFKKVLNKHKEEVRNDKLELLRLSKICKNESADLVLTHGDASTNVLVKAVDDIYLIDWDEMRLAPAERDLWMLDERPGVMEGYRSIRTNFKTNKNMRNFCILQYHFENMMLKFTEILNEERSKEDRLERVRNLAKGRMAGWRLPKVEETRL